MLRQQIAADVAAVARALATIIGSPVDPLRPPSAIDVVVGPARVRFDLATGSVSGHVQLAIDPMPPIAIDLSIASSAAQVEVSVGSIEPLVGGVALHVSAATGSTTSGARVSVEHRAPDGSVPATSVSVPVFPTADVDGLVDLAARLLPAALLQAAATTMRGAATEAGLAALDAALDALALLRAADEAGRRSVILPFGLIGDPVAWLQQRADPLAATVALMEALAPVVVPDRGAQPGWPFDPAFGVTYGVASGRLGVVAGLHLTETVDGAAVRVDVGAGLSVGPTGAPLPVVEATLTVDGWGLRLRSQPRFALELLRPAPATAIELWPESPGIGSIISDVGTSLVPVALNALAAHRNDAGSSLVKDTGAAVYELGDALGDHGGRCREPPIHRRTDHGLRVLADQAGRADPEPRVRGPRSTGARARPDRGRRRDVGTAERGASFRVRRRGSDRQKKKKSEKKTQCRVQGNLRRGPGFDPA